MALANKYDVFVWVQEVIDSCECLPQFISSGKLVENFYTLYNDLDMYWRLEECRDKKRGTIPIRKKCEWNPEKFKNMKI